MDDSEFYMWRAVFAFALADRELSDREQDLLNGFRESVHFSPEQLIVLRNDFTHPHDVELLYQNITQPEHKHRFCAMVRALAWSDGDLAKQEEIILKRVACLRKDADIFAQSRDHPYLHSFFDQYEKSGVMGFLQTPHILEVRV